MVEVRRQGHTDVCNGRTPKRQPPLQRGDQAPPIVMIELRAEVDHPWWP
jgi:hypothetical protein